MHRRRRRHDVTRLQPPALVTAPVGHHSPGLAHQQCTGGDVPGSEVLFEVPVEHACRRQAERSRSRPPPGAGPRTRAAPARTPGRTRAAVPVFAPEREAGRADGLFGLTVADPDRRRRCRTRPATGAPRTPRPSIGACTTPTTGSPSVDEPDRHTHHGKTVQKVGGAVEGVDEPAHFRPLPTTLLAEEREIGSGIVEHLAAPRPRWPCRRRSPSRPGLSRARCAARRRPRARCAPPASAARGRRHRATRRDPSRVDSCGDLVAESHEQLGGAGGHQLTARVGYRARRRRAVGGRRSKHPPPRTRVTRRGSPTGRADRDGRRRSRRGCRRRRRTARALPNPEHGTGATRARGRASRRWRRPRARGRRWAPARSARRRAPRPSRALRCSARRWRRSAQPELGRLQPDAALVDPGRCCRPVAPGRASAAARRRARGRRPVPPTRGAARTSRRQSRTGRWPAP